MAIVPMVSTRFFVSFLVKAVQPGPHFQKPPSLANLHLKSIKRMSPQTMKKGFLGCMTLALALLLLPARGFAQTAQAEDYTVLNTLKVSAGQLLVNQARLSFEKELAPKLSLEISGAYLFKNDFYYLKGYADEMTLASGFGISTGLRKYFDKKRYIFQPYFRSYLNLEMEFRRAGYDSLWFVFRGADSTTNECTLTTKKFNYLGFRVIFGVQKRAGRFVFDLYGGMGLRMISRQYNYMARNVTSAAGCAIVPGVTEFVFDNQTGTDVDFSPSFHAGIKLGIRWGKPRPAAATP